MSETGLYYFNARWVDPWLARFIQADTVVPEPGNAKAFDRFAYSLNNPLVYVDPSGHKPCGSRNQDPECWKKEPVPTPFEVAIINYCASNPQGMKCWGDENVKWTPKFDGGFMKPYLGYDPGYVSLPYHVDTEGLEPDQRFPWEGVANVTYNEHRLLHPLNPYLTRIEAGYFEHRWTGDAIGIMQTMINRSKAGKYDYACAGHSPNWCALKGGYGGPHRVLEERYYQFYALAFAVIVLNVRVDQPYGNFVHKDNNNIRGTHNDSTGFGPVGGPYNHYIPPIP